VRSTLRGIDPPRSKAMRNGANGFNYRSTEGLRSFACFSLRRELCRQVNVTSQNGVGD